MVEEVYAGLDCLAVEEAEEVVLVQQVGEAAEGVVGGEVGGEDL